MLHCADFQTAVKIKIGEHDKTDKNAAKGLHLRVCILVWPGHA